MDKKKTSDLLVFFNSGENNPAAYTLQAAQAAFSISEIDARERASKWRYVTARRTHIDWPAWW